MRHELPALPFELVVLEAALKEVVTATAMQVKELEGVALPALDALTKSVSHQWGWQSVRCATDCSIGAAGEDAWWHPGNTREPGVKGGVRAQACVHGGTAMIRLALKSHCIKRSLGLRPACYAKWLQSVYAPVAWLSQGC